MYTFTGIGGFVPRAKKAHDKRFSLTRNFGAPSLILPERFSVEDEKGDINGQRDQLRNFCTACTSSEIGADEWGKPMSQKFQALAISLIYRKPIYIQGAPIDVAMKSGRFYGFLPLDKEPQNIKDSDYEPYICDPANWPQDSSHSLEALKYKIPGGDFVVDGPYDHFDNYRAQLYWHKPDNGIALGMPWWASISSALNGIVDSFLWGTIFWHAVSVKGFEPKDGQMRIKVRSWDKNKGKDSYFFFNRETFNRILSTPGAIGKMYLNVDESMVEDLKERKLSITEQILNLYYQVLFRFSLIPKK